MNSAFTHRFARHQDIPALNDLMAAAIRELLRDFLSPEAVEASFDVMGLDTQLVDDGTYFVVEHGDAIAGCGGLRRPGTLFRCVHCVWCDADLSQPRTDPIRVPREYRR